MDFIQQPTPLDPTEIEVDFLRTAEVQEFGDHSPLIFVRGSAGDFEILDGPILAVDPEVEIQAANIARLLPVCVG
jgi:hypothetical protein